MVFQAFVSFFPSFLVAINLFVPQSLIFGFIYSYLFIFIFVKSFSCGGAGCNLTLNKKWVGHMGCEYIFAIFPEVHSSVQPTVQKCLLTPKKLIN